MSDETAEPGVEPPDAEARDTEPPDVGLDEFQRAWTELINAAIHARSRGGQGHEELTLTQTLLMEAVRGMDEPSVGAVARVVGVSSPSATRMIQQLERKGMMARRRSERDERSTVVHITEEGDRVLAARRAVLESKQRRMYDAIRPSLRPYVVTVLRDLREALDDV
ncbi:MarR family winged helix-turn-helix transcriptional regulator [Nocardiopsis sp. FIRDI 009]|uniref:MarR family winged helix-turn-helix transcriptional regulator n=1 Tax=Nocardiopsis sp. FIRDI 009 TaxID=714197 RepID=UPI000E263B19|nr:MarR family winged helix-turn-helix transcriptional regulator [Nocardiopsis sp. FIRDI 009]